MGSIGVLIESTRIPRAYIDRSCVHSPLPADARCSQCSTYSYLVSHCGIIESYGCGREERKRDGGGETYTQSQRERERERVVRKRQKERERESSEGGRERESERVRVVCEN